MRNARSILQQEIQGWVLLACLGVFPLGVCAQGPVGGSETPAPEHVTEEPGPELSLALKPLFQKASAAIAADRMVEPPGSSALFYLSQILEMQPDNRQALAALSDIQARLIRSAKAAAAEFDFERAESFLDQADRVPVSPFRVDNARRGIVDGKSRQAAEIEEEIEQLIIAGEFNRAEIVLIDLVALGVSPERVSSIRERVSQARAYGVFGPSEVVRDPILGTDQFAPPLVVIPAGSFMMGAADRDDMASDDQRPQHRVTLSRGFALGRNEVTVSEFREFIRVTRYRTEAEVEGHSKIYDEGSGRLTRQSGVTWRHDYAGEDADERMPVLHVSWNDTRAYAEWLANATGRPYRLPSEAEFEYALRAGSAGSYWWGEGTPMKRVENLAGDGDQSPLQRNWSVSFKDYSDGYWGPAPAGTFSANEFGLRDMAGNVSEWVADCWHASYLRAPVDGSAWVNPGCDRRVIRGGYWGSSPKQVRSPARLFADSSLRGPRVGFRIARDL